jgi:RHS repeat-associated protein
VDALGHTTVYTNDSSGNVLSVTVPYPLGADPANYTTRFTYNTTGEQTSVTLPTGGVITNEFDPVTGLLLAVRDGNQNLISATHYDQVTKLPVAETDAFGSLHYGYDQSGNLTQMTNSLGQVVTSGYDLNGNLTTLVDGGQTNTVSYDALNRETLADYGSNITVNFSYEGSGDWSSVNGPTIGHMERKMDDQGRLAGWETANGSNPSFAYDATGRLEYETNSLAVVTRSVYNAAGWLTASTNLATCAGTTYGYDAAGRRISVTNALGFATWYSYYPSGSLQAMTNAFGTNYWRYSDAAGACSGCGSSLSVTDPFDRATENIASPYGLPLSTVWRSGSLVSSNYTEYLTGLTTPEQEAEEYPVAIRDEGGRTRRYDYDEYGRLYRATDLSGATWWTNQFDTNGALIAVISPTAETNSYVYDELDNLKAIQFSDNNWLTNFYDATNRLSGVRLPSGVSVTNFYDFAGRLANRSSTIGETASFQYNGNDAVTKMSDNTGSTTNLYDAAGRLWGIDYPSGASLRYQLDLLDRITSLTNKASTGGTAYVTRYQYDPGGNVTNVNDPFNRNTRYEYDRVGRRTKRTLPNGIVTEWQYDWRDRVTNITHNTSGGSTLASFTYWRNPGGEPWKIVRESGTKYVLLEYDTSLRLANEVYYTNAVNAIGGSVEEQISYAYDASGSRIRRVKGGMAYTNVVTAGYQITQVKTNGGVAESYAYDSGGRVTQIARDGLTVKLGYNTADQVRAVTNGSGWVTYTHDANGRRTFSTNSDFLVRRFLVAPAVGTDMHSPQLIANASATVQQGYVYLGDHPILRYDSGGNAVYYLEDAMGSVAALVDASQTKIASFNYDGFGNVRSQSGSTSPPTGTGGDFRFHSAWLEAASGLYNMRAREYDPRLGRFTSRDPVDGVMAQPESFNIYAYVLNNPHVFSDPSGKTSYAEETITSFVQFILNQLRIHGVQKARQFAFDQIKDALVGLAKQSLLRYLPANLGEAFQGVRFGEKIRQILCYGSGEGGGVISGYLYFGTPLSPDGDPLGPGLTCSHVDDETGQVSMSKERTGINPQKVGAFIDMVIGSERPCSGENGKPGTLNKTWAVLEVKLSAQTVVDDYFKDPNKKQQLTSMLRYARKHTYSHTAVILTAKYTRTMHHKAFKVYEQRLKKIAAGAHCYLEVGVMTDFSRKRRK